MKPTWQTITVAEDETHHLLDNQPLYQTRFKKVLKFHAPGLAPVMDASGAYHIDINGSAIYPQRFLQTFGYYENLAAAESTQGWLHLDINGNSVYEQRYAWCGNFQEGLCPVKESNTSYYYHINTHGKKTYIENYCYAGDYRDGIAVVCNEKGLHTHIDKQGNYIHKKWFLGLDVFHKSVARAKDNRGWFHVNKQGEPLYSQRYKIVEPFYNNVAHVEMFDGSLLTINLKSEPLTSIYKSDHSLLHELSADLIGFWKTQTIYVAVKLAVFDAIPNTTDQIAIAIKIDKKICQRLLRALQELGLVELINFDSWQVTAKGSLLKPTQKSAMAAATIVWGESHYQRWAELFNCMQTTTLQNKNYFNLLAEDKTLLPIYQQALSGYALQDYSKIMDIIAWPQHHCVIDAGGGTGTLLHALLDQHPHLTGMLLEMPTVINLTNKHARCQYYGVDFLQPWPCQADAILLARVLHDWCDEKTLMILQHAKASLKPNGKIYVIEMLLEANTGAGGLLDLNMLVMTGGCERTLQDWQALVTQAQLRITHIISLTSVASLLVLETNV